VGNPTPSTIAGYVKETEDGTIMDSANGQSLTAGEYIAASISYTNEKCHNFFNVLEHFKQDSELIDTVITAAVAAGSPLLALTSASKSTQALVVSGLTFGNQYNKAVADIFAFSAFKEQLMTHVFDGMAAYIAALKKSGANTVIDSNRVNSSDFLASRDRKDLLIARSIASDYASLCSLATMRKIVGEALANTTTSVTTEAKTAGALQPSTSRTLGKTGTQH
jgi:hypothetical protein